MQWWHVVQQVTSLCHAPPVEGGGGGSFNTSLNEQKQGGRQNIDLTLLLAASGRDRQAGGQAKVFLPAVI